MHILCILHLDVNYSRLFHKIYLLLLQLAAKFAVRWLLDWLNIGLEALLEDKCLRIRERDGYPIVVVVVVAVVVEEADGLLVIWVVAFLAVVGDCSPSIKSIVWNLPFVATQLWLPQPLLLLLSAVMTTGDEHNDVDLSLNKLFCFVKQPWVLDLTRKEFLEAVMSERFWGSWNRTELISSSVVSDKCLL